MAYPKFSMTRGRTMQNDAISTAILAYLGHLAWPHSLYYWACHQSILDIRYYLVHPYDTCDCYERLCSYYDVEGGTMSTKRNQRTQRIPDISALKVKPH